MRRKLGSLVHKLDNMAGHRYLWLCYLNDWVNQYHPTLRKR